MTNGANTDVSSLTLDKLKDVMTAMRLSNPRHYAMMELSAALQNFPVEAIEKLANLTRRGMFDFLKQEDLFPASNAPISNGANKP